MNESQPISPRSRLQALLAIPEKQRTEAQWDELNELEIMLAPGNREGSQEQNVRRNPNVSAPNPGHPGRQKQGGGGGGMPHGKKPLRKFHKRPPKSNTP